jgi:hypothetical protein
VTATKRIARSARILHRHGCGQRFLAEKAPRGGERGKRVARQRRRARLLRQLLAVGIERDRYVQIRRRRIAERPLQRDLPRCRSEEIGAAHDMRDALVEIIDDDRDLVGEQAVGAPDDEIADVARKVLPLRSLQPIGKRDDRVADPHP